MPDAAGQTAGAPAASTSNHENSTTHASAASSGNSDSPPPGGEGVEGGQRETPGAAELASIVKAAAGKVKAAEALGGGAWAEAWVAWRAVAEKGWGETFTVPDVVDFEGPSVVPREEGKAFMDASKGGDAGGLERSLLARPDLLWYRGQGTSYGFVGHTALHYCAAKGHVACLRTLLLAGSQVNAKNRGGSSVLHSAAMNDSVECARILIAAGANPRMGDQDGELPEDAGRRRGKIAAADVVRDAVAAARANPGGLGEVERVQKIGPPDARGRAAARVFVEKFDQARIEWTPPPPPAPRPAPPPAPPKKEKAAEAEKAPASSSSEEDQEAMAQKVEDLRIKGNQAFGRKDFSAAVSSYSLAIRLDGKNHLALSNRSAAFAALGNFEKALEDAQQVVKLVPTWAKGYSRLGAALHGGGQWAEAARSYKAGLDLEPENESLREGVAAAIRAVQEATGEDPVWLRENLL